MQFIKGNTYRWQEILDGLEAVNAPPYYLLRHRVTQKVVAACLVVGLNPRAPYEIIPAKGPLIRRYADAFCKQRGTLEVFVQEADKQWYCRGRFQLTGESNDENEIELRALQANRRDLYKILFLQEAEG